MKVSEQAIYLAQLKGMDSKEADKRLRHWFIKFGIQNWWDKKVEELSKGMQQKIQFIVTVIHEPKLLIFDEPFSGFDPINVNLLKNEILELREKGATILFSTHNMASVEELCDNIMLINQGRKILEGRVSDIKQQYKQHKYDVVYKPFDGSDVTRLTVNATNPNDLVRDIIEKGEIVSLNEILPSMNDIFINLVSASNK
jgi:ABC-2 type transport system ATP-binding protein